MALVSLRYAKALFDLTDELKTADKTVRQLEYVSEIYSNNADFRDFINNPENKSEDKKSLVSVVAGEQADSVVLNFLKLLIDKNRFRFLPEIIKEFALLSDEKNNILNITIVSAMPLEQEYVAAVCEKFKKRFGAAGAKAQVKTDPSQIGGIKVIIGDKLYDNTVLKKLNLLKAGMTV